MPSPRILAIFFIILALASLGWFWYFPNSFGQSEVYENEALVATSLPKSSLDSDNDGLKDWKEALNVYSSGVAEVAEDSILPTGVSEQANLTEYITQAFSQSVGPRLLTGQGEVRPEDFKAIQNYLPSGEEILGQVPKVNTRELHISEDTRPEAVKNYFNQVYLVYEKNLLTLPEDDLAIVARAFQNENFSELGKIDSILLAFDKSISEIKKISVPKGLENFALKELNYLLKTRRAVEILRNAGADPLAAMAILQLRVSLMSEVNNFHQDTKKELLKNGISFESGEGGYILFQ